MALTSVGAFYATVSKLLQRVYIPHGDDSEIAQQPITAGESLLLVPLATYQQGGAPAVQALIGTPSITGFCAIVDPNSRLVIDHFIADTAIYNGGSGKRPDGNLIAAEAIGSMVGDTWDGTNFSRPYAEVSSSNGQVVSISTKTVPAVAATSGNYLVSHPPAGWAVNQTVLPASKVGVKAV